MRSVMKLDGRVCKGFRWDPKTSECKLHSGFSCLEVNDDCKAVVYEHGRWGGWSLELEEGSYKTTDLVSAGGRSVHAPPFVLRRP